MEEENNNENDDEIENAVFEEVRDAELETKGKNKLDKEIDRLEDKIINPKPWQLKGEIRSAQRPKNSLLEEKLDFKSGVQLLENTVSKEFSEHLEKTIRQRILDEAWDDVAEYAFAKPIQENFANAEQLNFEKSQKGLADIYEDKFKKNILNLPIETEGDKAKIEIKELFKNICYNLDNLSNLSFIPKPQALVPAKISVNNIASIQREEKIPVFVSEGMQKTANELFDQKKRNFCGDFGAESQQFYTRRHQRIYLLRLVVRERRRCYWGDHWSTDWWAGVWNILFRIHEICQHEQKK